MAKQPVSVDAARLRMADLCARSEQCEADIRQKLYRLGLTPPQVQQVIESLIEERFIDNARFACSYARDKCRFSAWGNNKIRLGLHAKRIPADLITAALQSIDRSDYLDALKRTALAKARGLDLNGEQGRENRLKLFRHILSRGFESDLASRAVRELTSKREGR